MDLRQPLLSLVDVSGLDGQWRELSTYGDIKFHSTRISLAFGSRSTSVGNGEYASTLNMPELWDKLQGADCDDKGTQCFAKICDEIREDRDATDMLSCPRFWIGSSGRTAVRGNAPVWSYGPKTSVS